MIDYEKLEEAHELAEKYYEQTGESAVIEYNIYCGCADDGHLLFIDRTKIPNVFTMDEIIDKLKELTQPETRYKVGDVVWAASYKYPNTGMAISILIEEIDYDCDEKYYGLECWWVEEGIYPSREALIEAQIEYWTCLKNEEKSTGSDDVSMECEHESDGNIYTSNPPQNKCKKCGEFYR